MKEFRIKWTACPTAYNVGRIMFVEAENFEDAKLIAKDHIERSFGVAHFVLDLAECGEANGKANLPAGRVISG